jgi:hypothetical protein
MPDPAAHDPATQDRATQHRATHDGSQASDGGRTRRLDAAREPRGDHPPRPRRVGSRLGGDSDPPPPDAPPETRPPTYSQCPPTARRSPQSVARRQSGHDLPSGLPGEGDQNAAVRLGLTRPLTAPLGDARDAIVEGRRELAEAKIERAVNEALTAAPPLTQDQRDRLTVLLQR